MQISSCWHLLSIMALQHLLVNACSISCTCKWKNGKRTAECSGKSLADIPDTIEPETQVLDFSDNNLGKLVKELFFKKQLVNLQRLYLSQCRIKTIHRDTFKGLTNLVELDLTGNFLGSVPTLAFPNCPSLMKLTLSLNPIRDIKRLAFNHLSYLNTLELSGCEIAEIQEGAFQGLHSLEWLYLPSNRLRNIEGPHTIPKSLKGIKLQGNPWVCDCHIQPLHDWLNTFSAILVNDPQCVEPPRLRKTNVRHVRREELACLPEVQPTTLYLELMEGKNVSLQCHIHAVPEATVTWSFDGQLLQNNSNVAPGMHLIYWLEEGAENKKSELFIYNANAVDNGTYICHAENLAGATQSNFTIRIVLKEEPTVIIVALPFQQLIFIVIGVSVVTLLIITCAICCVLKCQRNKRREQAKDQLDPSGENEKNWVTKSHTLSPKERNLIKENCTQNSSCTSAGGTTEELVLYGIRECGMEQFGSGMSPLRVNRGQTVSPLSLRRHQIPDQNPDLIDGTDSIGCQRRAAGDGEDGRQQQQQQRGEGSDNNGMSACIRNGREFHPAGGDQSALGIHMVVDGQGYPVDYGLPKLPYSLKSTASSCINEQYYRTLPCNRMKRHSAANPLKRYSREVEFLSRSIDSPYDHYHTADIRYTADGYPVPRQPSGSGGTPPPDWSQPAVPKKCASAQTDTEDDTSESSSYIIVRGSVVCASVPEHPEEHPNANDVLTESPDEGYEGEPPSSVV
ncbi:leucine-rich repeat-containing protein 24-like [Anthonomus grandis grandis]|uniref:leucine-rich repeat-containing protein 24-like n=1 Tax=Anthonomus grandis grandis TaxID=2921223 RepID=UPI002165E75E|nr:leucine-rich repeat-containing protein 24-like [Anthonomus grandis grandis]XP_050297127.1 leucine-rich repeat-containing protein 24-like [Anthonomus grandis grandis]